MANMGDRPNLKICIDNREDDSDAEGEVRSENETNDGLDEDDAASGSPASDNYSESAERGSRDGNPDEISDEDLDDVEEEEDDDIEQAILKANVPTGEFVEDESLPVSMSRIKKEHVSEPIPHRPKKLNIPRSEKQKLEDIEIEQMYESLGFTIAQLEKSNDRGIRLEAVHMRGVEDMEEEDVLDYFKQFEPASVEWIDDESCNVVWKDPMRAAAAMLKLSVKSQLNSSDVDSDSDSQETMETEDKPRKAGGESKNRKLSDVQEDDELNLLSDEEDNETGEKIPAKELERRHRQEAEVARRKTQEGDDLMEVDGEKRNEETEQLMEEREEGEMEADDSDNEKENKRSERTGSRRKRSRLKVPPGKWRIGVAHPKADVLFFRFANKADVPAPGAERRRKLRKKYGNSDYGDLGIKGLVSESKRREIKAKQDELELEKAKEAIIKKHRSLEDHSIPDFLLEDVPELPEEFAAYSEPPPKDEKPKIRELHSKSSLEEKRLRMKRKRSESDDSPETDVEEELNALLRPGSAAMKRLPIGRMHADEEEEKIKAIRSRTLDSAQADPTDARSLILRRKHKRMLVSRDRKRDYESYEDQSSEGSAGDWTDESQSEEEDYETFGVAPSGMRSRSSRHGRSKQSRHRQGARARTGTSRYSRDPVNKPSLKDLPSLTIQVEAD